ncbi:MAG: acetyl-CoA carboxylase, carboxyltransferase subunit beta [Actinomycetota bacterium]|nr:acetyl-CoA carboxylase, carboxyltransferase subunit beta [Actinomycetota bacterium]MDI6821639.1 acetyl-CoA carboxylase, carboxyltransferase subunit beta [Actinomycetota bacterium]
MPISEWFHKKGKNGGINPSSEKREIPEGIWSRCAACNEIIFQGELLRNHRVCPKCNYHFSLTPWERINLLIDGNTFKEFNPHLCSKDPLEFVAAKSYLESLSQARERTGLDEAVVTGEGQLNGHKVILGVMDFRFVGGSMGSVVGEKITRIVEKAEKERIPLITVSASGGARMQEGMLSLAQMAKTSAALARLHEARVPYIAILTHPTTGGVAASFAMLGDVIISEPRALIGFAGPRVIEKTMKQKLPRGFQTAEFLLEHGMIDMVVVRGELKSTISKLLDFFTG